MSTCGTCKHWKKDEKSCVPPKPTGLCGKGQLAGFHTTCESASCKDYEKYSHVDARLEYYELHGRD